MADPFHSSGVLPLAQAALSSSSFSVANLIPI
jgi:hypothetical protein